MKTLCGCLLVVVVGCGSAAGSWSADAGSSAFDAGPAAGRDDVDAGPGSGSDADAAFGGNDAGSPMLRVLFIGNSYTSVNDLPAMLELLAATAGVPPLIKTEQVTVGGASLTQHWLGPDAQARINERTWSHVVLQGQSLEPLQERASFELGADALARAVVDAGAQPTWFVTWARGATDAGYLYPGGPEEMQDRLTREYGKVAALWPNSLLSCVGDAFQRAQRAYPEITLYQPDLSHPTVAGTYLAACTFYSALTGWEVPSASAVPVGVTASEAAALRQLAKVGSHCAGRTLKANLELRACPTCPTGGNAIFSYGTAGLRLSNVFFLFNKGESVAGLSDGLTLAPPFEWSQGMGFPGGSGPLTVSGAPYAWCGSQLAPDSGCALSVDFTGAATGQGRVSVAASGTYSNQSAISGELYGWATTRALLTISEESGYFGCTDATCGHPAWLRGDAGELVQGSFVVTNRGAQSATLREGDPLPVLCSWGDPGWDGGYPGGRGGTTVGGTSYPFCGSTLAPGQQCAVRVAAPAAGPALSFSVNVAYSDAAGAIAPNANRRSVCSAQ